MQNLEQDFYEWIRHYYECSDNPKSEWWFQREYEFTTLRKYRLDFVWPFKRIAFEINGAIYKRGGHSTGKGISRDYEKWNHASALGWTVLVLNSDMVHDGGYLKSLIDETLRNKKL